MKRVEAACPNCGAMVEFQISSSLVSICDFCQSVVARTDVKLEDFGQVARVVPRASPLHLDLTGTYRHKSYTIAGHLQYSHAGGGLWDEWYAAFPGNRWGWVAEAQGKIYVSFPRKMTADAVPDYNDLRVGQILNIRGFDQLTVVEIGTASVVAGEGEMPFVVRPGASHRYVDLAGANGTFATLEYADSGKVVLYLGREATLQELGLAPVDAADDSQALEIAAVAVNCPNCGGSLDLRAPDQTERVFCPFCAAMLDADHGELKYLRTLKFKKSATPVIPLGSKGHLRGHDYTVIGFMQRSVLFDRRYYWTEYLLHNPQIGFRWLVHSDNHWSFVEPLHAGDVHVANSLHHLRYKGKHFRLFQKAKARVEYVLGEFYWKVQLYDNAWTRDYIAPPQMVSVETAEFGKAGQKVSQEITYSLGTYLPHKELQQAFKLKTLPRGWGVAPNQPRPVNMASMFGAWAAFVMALLLIYAVTSSGLSFGEVDAGWFWLSLLAVTAVPALSVLYTASFERSRWEDSEFNPYSSE